MDDVVYMLGGKCLKSKGCFIRNNCNSSISVSVSR